MQTQGNQGLQRAKNKLGINQKLLFQPRYPFWPELDPRPKSALKIDFEPLRPSCALFLVQLAVGAQGNGLLQSAPQKAKLDFLARYPFGPELNPKPKFALKTVFWPPSVSDGLFSVHQKHCKPNTMNDFRAPKRGQSGLSGQDTHFDQKSPPNQDPL